jgi:hypothetical protein
MRKLLPVTFMGCTKASPMPTADELFQTELRHRGLPFRVTEDGFYAIQIGDISTTVNLENVRRNYARDKDSEAIARFVNQLDGDAFGYSPDWLTAKPFIRGHS